MQYVVVGTVLLEPVLLALRRIAHADVARRTLQQAPTRRAATALNR